MQALRSMKLTGTTNTSGALTVLGTRAVFGWLYAVEWIDGTFDDGVDAVISCVDTPSGEANTLLTLTDANNDAWYYPRATEHSQTGTSSGGSTFPLVNGTLKLVVSSGGNTKTGGCVVYWFE